ncbi:MAG: adenosine deaminase [Chloroflexi bacterium]|nr:adenosine deaminase [Chloroflexota bacterium]
MRAPPHDHDTDSALRETLQALPKIDLHRHLEGSLRLETLVEIAHEHGLDLPASDIEALRPLVQVTENDRDFRDFLAKFDVLRRFYQTPEGVSRLAYEVVADAAADNIKYLELRFTPMALAKAQNFALEDVADWVIEAVNRAQADFGIQVRLIASFNRHEPVDVGRRVTQIAVDRIGKGITGLDLAGDEVNFGSGPFAPLFVEAHAAGLGITVHAGEWTGPDTVREAIEQMSAMRIGHGVRVVEDSSVVQLALERKATFEVCVTSNVQSGVVARLEDHPLHDLYSLNLRTTINTDDPSVCDVTLTHEYMVAVERLGFEIDDVKRTIITAAESAFVPPGEKADLVARFRKMLGLPALRAT